MLGSMVREKYKTNKEYNPKHTLLVDVSNIFWVMRFSTLKSETYDIDGPDLIFQDAFSLIFNLKKERKADNIVLAFDSKNTWRKQIEPSYKSGRKTHLDIYKDDIIKKIDQFYELFDEYSDVICIKVDECEADDIIALYVENKYDSEKISIISTDKDFIQLINDDVYLFDPVKRNLRSSDIGIEEDLFIKCFRGDSSDNIKNIYPRIRKNKLLDAFNDEYERMNLMESYGPIPDAKVKDLYEHNRTLIDLKMQPSHIRDRIKETISSKKNYDKYDEAKFFLKLKELDLPKILDSYLW